jgi:hypothetical protein
MLDRLLLRARPSAYLDEDEIEEPEPLPAWPHQETTEIQLSMRCDAKVTQYQAESFLLSLFSCARPVAFEVLGSCEEVVLQFACDQADARTVRQQLQAAFPDASLHLASGELARHFAQSSGRQIATVDFGLSAECMSPLRIPEKWNDIDPISALAAVMSNLDGMDSVVFQILFTPVQAPWAPNFLRAVTTWDGKAFFLDAPELLKQAQNKASRPLYAVSMTATAAGSSVDAARGILRGIAGALAQFNDPGGNSLIPLDDEYYPSDERVEHVVQRISRRSGMLLNVQELAALAHPPAASVAVPKLRRDDGRTRLAPAELTAHQYVLGESRHLGETRVVSIPPEMRRRHMHVIGATGTGKSTLLLNLMVQDMEHGEGFALFDPHGDLVEDVLRRIPAKRLPDAILIDPSDTEYVVGVNVLHAHSDIEKTLIASDMVAVFRRLSTSWGDQMTAVLANAVMAILESERGGTLVELRRFLVEKEFRDGFLPSVRDAEIREYWQNEYPRLKGHTDLSILARLSAFLRQRPLRAMVAADDRVLDFSAVMDEGRIVLCKLSHGLIGQENAALLGSLLIGKFQQLALARQARQVDARRPFYIYADEFQHVATPTLTTLLSGGRKYGIGLVLAHQETRQVSAQNPELLSALLSNAATRVAFRVGEEDARRLVQGLTHFDAAQLQNLRVGQAMARVERNDADFSLVTPGPPSLGANAEDVREKAVAESRERFGQRIPTTPPELVSAHVPTRVKDPHLETRPSSPESRPSTDNPQPFSAGVAPSIPTPGRGGARHKYLQELIKRWGEANGWRVAVEKAVLDGLGRVDVALERDGVSVACEIGVSSSNHHEMQNIQKCLAAGVQFVVAVVLEPKRAKAMTAAVAQDLGEDASRVVVTSPEGLFEVLSGLQERSTPERKTVRGYEVRLKTAPSRGSMPKPKSVAQTIVGALQRLTGKPDS